MNDRSILRRVGGRTTLTVLAIGAAGVAIGVGGFSLSKSANAQARAGHGLAAKIQAAFPNTKVGSVTCGVAPGLCEVTAGRTVFYVSSDGRFALVGALLDLKSRVDLTDRRVKELGQLDAVTSRLADNAGAPQPAPAEAGATVAHPEASLGPIKIDLPIANAIVHHPGAPLKVSAITDLNCGYCRMLIEAIKAAPDIELTEYPIQLLRPDSLDKAKLVLCAKDREASANAIYLGGDLKVAGDCAKAEAAVQANTAFARVHGVSGTPALIRSDGAAHAGFMPIDQLRAWLKGGQA
jgi:thiol:disulfide interchange protein DsbC